ncbi:hypothetical protein VNO78_17666 [Psophocarpus tetragonolobus]|uniref:Uncharacterized protein n=1 Tax=Psophocarpus tetragonolobus TaxID=3891 RepID=A0AAN9XLC2_PSOTE
MFAWQSSDLEAKSREGEGDLELDEADMWNWNDDEKSSGGTEWKKEEGGGRVKPVAVASSSMPLIIPECSNILKDEDYNGREPPHEYLARTRGPSHSVLEGKGRTLKGTAFRTFRNSLWNQLGIPD